MRAFAADDNFGRKSVCQEIDALSAQLRRINDEIDEIERPGNSEKSSKQTVASSPTVVPLDLTSDPVALLRSVQNLRTRLSKWKKRLEEEMPKSKRTEIEHLIQLAQKELSRVHS